MDIDFAQFSALGTKEHTVTEQLPKEQLLLKLLKMTTSAQDAEALVAIRKANELLISAGWDWDKLIAGKIKVVENPFANLGVPQGGRRPMSGQPTSPPPTAPPPPRWSPKQGRLGTGINKFPGHCYVCGIEVIATAGYYFRPCDFNQNAPNRFAVVCSTCETRDYKAVGVAPAMPIKKRGTTSVSDLV